MNTIDVLGKSFSSEGEALAALQAELARIERLKHERLDAEIAGLPEKLGLAHADEVIRLLAKHASPELRRRIEGQPETRSMAARVRLTEEARQAIVGRLTEGKTGQAVAHEFGVSLATIQNIKKNAGLVRTSRS